MNLDDTFQLLTLQIAVDGDALSKFAAEDRIGGWDLDKGGWPVGSLWSVEGKVLYALTRLLRPDLVVEIGTHRGCSTTHFATALDINDNGLIVTLDTAPGVGDLIPSTLNKRVNKVMEHGGKWLFEQPDESIDIIYEDADHSAETSMMIAQLATQKLKPGGLHIVHDAAHDTAWLGDGSQIHSDVGATIRRGLEMALGNQFRVYRTDPSDCGFALWQKPGLVEHIGLNPQTMIDIHSVPAGQNPALAQAIANLRGSDAAAVQEVATVADEAEAYVDFESMTKQQLRDYAAEHGINVTGAKTRDELLDKITGPQSVRQED